MDQVNITRPLVNKKVDNFYVRFLSIPDNISNILGRQVKSIERPSIIFNYAEFQHKGVRQYVNGTIDSSSPISIIFHDDDGSLTTKAIYQQIYRQAGVQNKSDDNTFENSKFSIHVQCFDSTGNMVEEFTLKGCWIVSLSHSENILEASTDNEIITSIQWENVDYNFSA